MAIFFDKVDSVACNVAPCAEASRIDTHTMGHPNNLIFAYYLVNSLSYLDHLPDDDSTLKTLNKLLSVSLLFRDQEKMQLVTAMSSQNMKDKNQ